MVVSLGTAVAAYDALERRVPDRAARGELLADLLKVKGNRSFRETVGLLVQEHEARHVVDEDEDEGRKGTRT